MAWRGRGRSYGKGKGYGRGGKGKGRGRGSPHEAHPAAEAAEAPLEPDAGPGAEPAGMAESDPELVVPPVEEDAHDGADDPGADPEAVGDVVVEADSDD